MASFGSLKITQQAFIISLIGLIAGVFIAFKGMAVAGLVIMAGAFIAAYNANCAVVGKCRMWAWTLVVVYGVNMFLLGKLAIAGKNLKVFK